MCIRDRRLRALRHCNGKINITRAIWKYPDTRAQSAISARAEHRFVLRHFLENGIVFLGFTRAADELQSCSAQQFVGNHQGQ
eukprot:6034566-Pyramimonas_sp.AAC.1